MASSSGGLLGKLKSGLRKQNSSSPDPSDVPSDEILPFEMTYLTPAMVHEAKTKLKETDEVRERALDEIRRLIDAEETLATPTDDTFLLAFLRSRKFNVKKAFRLLQNYWAFRKEYRYIYDTTDPLSVTSLIYRSFVGFLQYRDRNGSVVFLAKIARWNPEQDSYEDLFRAISAILIFAVEFPATQITGFRIILDIRGLSWAQIKYCTPSNIVLLIRSTQFCFPARFKGIHILSDNKMFNFIWTVAYPLLTAKLKRRICIHGENLDPLRENIHPSILPREFGGDAPEFDNSKWVEIIENNTHKVVGLLNYGYKN